MMDDQLSSVLLLVDKCSNHEKSIGVWYIILKSHHELSDTY